MKKKSKTTTIHRMDPKKGNFVTMSKDILTSTELTDKAKVLLMLMLNNADNWNISVCYYGKLLGWGNTTLSNTVKNLVMNGYLLTDKHSKGKGLGFLYTYVVSEFGNLNPNKTIPTKEEVKEFLDEQEQQLSEEPLQLEVTQQEVESINVVAEETAETKEVPQDEISEKEVLLYFNNINKALEDVSIDYKLSDEFIEKVNDHYTNKAMDDIYLIRKISYDIIKKAVISSIEKNEANAMKQIEAWIEFNNKKGTAVQREDIKNKTIKFFKERWEYSLEEVKEKDVTHRLLLYRTEILGANRVHDSRFQD